MAAHEAPATSAPTLNDNPPATPLRKALVVLGMHRSGTSALTRVLSLLGADLPVRLMPPVENDNPRGFWEPEGVARLHDEMLATVDSSWDDFLPLPERWHELSTVRPHLRQMLELLHEEFADSTLFVLKDPRICRVVPMWREILRQFDADPRFVIALRNPLEVAASLQARDAFPINKSLALWLRYVLDAELFTRGQLRTFVSYEQLLGDWRRVTDKIAADLKLSWPRCHYRACLEIDEFLSAKERHHEIGDHEFERNSMPSSWVKKAYAALRRMEEGALDEGIAVLDGVRSELAVAEQAYGVIFADYRRKLQGVHHELEEAQAQTEQDRSEGQRQAEQLQLVADQSRTSAEQLQRRLEEVQAHCEQLQSCLEQLQVTSEQFQSKSAQLAWRLQESESHCEQLQSQAERYRSEADARNAELVAAQEACREKTTEMERLRGELSTREAREAEHQNEIAACRAQLADASQEAERVRNALLSREAELSDLRCEKENLQQELVEHADDLNRTRNELDALRSRLLGQDQQLAAKDRDVARLQQELRARDVELATERAQSVLLEQERTRGDQALSRWTGTALSLRESSRALAVALTQVSEAHSVRGLARRAYRQFGSRMRLWRRHSTRQRRERLLASGLFDPGYYLLHNADVLSAGMDPLDHFLLCGGREGRNPCALFDAAYYLRTNADVASSGINPLVHYLLCGAAEHRKPCALFDTAYYLQEHADVAPSGQNPLTHYLQCGAEEGRNPHPLFHTRYYLRENPEVRVLRINPLAHYLEHGAADGRKPNALFDVAYYLRENPDVAAAKLDPLEHYVEIGAAEGRNPNPWFDTAFYLGANADVAAAGINPLQHYLQRGGREGRRPSPGFDTAAYLKQNPDVAAAGMNPLEHYLEHGVQEGRRVVDGGRPQGGTLPEPVVFPRVGAPLVSVIVPVHNRWSATLQCLRSIQWNTGDLPYEVILADDGSTDETAQAAGAVANLTVVAYRPGPSEPGRWGLVRNGNQAARRAQGKYLVFLAPDALVQSGWLEAMVALAEHDETAGIIGPKLLSPNGLLKEAGRIVWNDASDAKYGGGDDPHRPEYSHVRQADYVSSSAFLVRRALFEQVGGFDERFAPSGYEDADLAFKCRRQGYKVFYQPKAAVIHRGTEGGSDPDQVAHRLYFEQKWSQVLKEEHLPPDAQLFLARDHSRPAQHLLYCDWDVPAADRDSGSFRACNLMQILIEMGYRLTFLPANLYPAEPQVDRLRQMGIFAACGTGFNSLEGFFAQYGGYFDAVIVSRVNVAEECMGLVRKYCRKAYRVFDTTDLHFLREQREAELAGDDALRAKAAATRTTELGFIDQADVTLVVSPVEKELLRKEAPQARVEIVSNIHPVHGSARPFSERKDMLFIGGFNHRPNPDAVKWLAKDIFPRIRQRLPGVNLYVIGSHPPVDVLALNSDDFRVLGYVADAEPYFDQCRLSVVPLRYGAGVKGKINMSMSYGLPVVSTAVGCEGMFLADGADVLVADDAEAFADAVCRLYTDAALWQRLSAGGLENVERYFSFEAARQALGEIFSSPSAAGRGLARAA